MAAEHAREAWTDERLDDLARRMDDGFARVEAEMRTLRSELSARIDAQGAALNARIDAMQRTMLQLGGGMIASILVGAAGIVATQL